MSRRTYLPTVFLLLLCFGFMPAPATAQEQTRDGDRPRDIQMEPWPMPRGMQGSENMPHDMFGGMGQPYDPRMENRPGPFHDQNSMQPRFGTMRNPQTVSDNWSRQQRMSRARQWMGPHLEQDLTVDRVRHIMQYHLANAPNKRLQVGDVTDKDDDTITVEIVTRDGSLVHRLDIDRHTGFATPDFSE